MLDAWGFKQKMILTWAKERRGGGVGDSDNYFAMIAQRLASDIVALR